MGAFGSLNFLTLFSRSKEGSGKRDFGPVFHFYYDLQNKYGVEGRIVTRIRRLNWDYLVLDLGIKRFGVELRCGWLRVCDGKWPSCLIETRAAGG